MSGFAFSLVGVVALTAAGCAHVEARPPSTVAVLPVDVLGVPVAEGLLLQGALQKALDEAPQVRRIDVADAPLDARCRDDDGCWREALRALPVESCLMVTVAGLGSTRLVRTRVVVPAQGLVKREWQDTVTGANALSALGGDVVRRLFPSLQRPWYAQWWVWSLAGIAFAAAGVTTAVMLGRPVDPNVIHLGSL